jgi:hypothetical protein
LGAIELDRLTWPEVKAEQENGRDTVVDAFVAHLLASLARGGCRRAILLPTHADHGARYWQEVLEITLKEVA